MLFQVNLFLFHVADASILSVGDGQSVVAAGT